MPSCESPDFQVAPAVSAYVFYDTEKQVIEETPWTNPSHMSPSIKTDDNLIFLHTIFDSSYLKESLKSAKKQSDKKSAKKFFLTGALLLI